MKLLATGLIIGSLLTFINIDAQITILDPISVTNGDNSYGYRTPKIEINGNGEPVILWIKPGSLEALYILRKSGSVFTEPVAIPLGGINPSVWSGNLSPGLAVHENHVYVVFEKYGEAIYLSHSDDFGDTWDDPVAAFVPPDGRVATIPNITVDFNGNPLVAYVNTNEFEEDAHYGLVKSIDFGANFSEEVEVNAVSEGSEVCECCNGDIAVSENGDVFVAFRNNNENLRDCWVAHSIDGGENFTTVYDMDETDWVANACPNNGPNLFVDNDKVVLTFFSAAADWDNGAYYAAVDLNNSEIGATLSIPFSGEDTSNQTAPRIAGEGDIIGIVTQETIAGVASVTMSISFEGSTGLENESFELFESNTTQRYPAVTFHDSKFHVVYEHSQTGTVHYQKVSVVPESVSELSSISNVAYPIPTSDKLWVKGYSHNVNYRIIDISGRTLMTGNISSERPLSMKNLNDGTYILEINENGNVHSQKIVILH